MIQLGINIDHVATLRQARGTRYPDPVEAAFRAQKGGADGITVHLREDRRHIQERDVLLLLDTIEVPLNLEMGATEAMLAFACAHPPAECCLVPEKREELTTEGGLDAAGQISRLQEAIAALSAVGSRVSLFLDPDPRQLAAAAAVGAPVVELHTGRYADATTPAERAREYEALYQAAEEGVRLGLTLHAGHGLTHHNVAPICRLPGIKMLNIGHAIVARAVMTGMEESVASMKRIMIEAAKGGA